MKLNQFRLFQTFDMGALLFGGLIIFQTPSAAAPTVKSSSTKSPVTKRPSLKTLTQKRAESKTSVLRAPLISIRDVKTVYYRRALGNSYFTAQLREQLVADGLKFVSNVAAADAILDTKGQYVGRAFAGKMVFTDQNDRVIWSQDVVRPDNSGVMAYLKLSQAMRAKRR